MCSHYQPLITPGELLVHFGVSDVPAGLRGDLWPGQAGPFVRRHEFADVGDEAVPPCELQIGSFGLIPHWAKDPAIARRTYNARTETVHEKPSFRDAWKAGRHCIIPAAAIFEPDWRSGKAIPTRIARADGKPMGIAGLWGRWKSPHGDPMYGYTMLTINADRHPFMRNYHKPQDEKRMVVILQEQDYEGWLDAPAAEGHAFLRPFPADNLAACKPEQAQASLWE